jgi:serine/threonine-protein kinase
MSEIQIPGIEILGLIGRGGMASVWKGRQVSLDRIVAVKVLSAHFSHTAADVERFQDEARAAARLKHPGIVQVYDAGNQNGAYYFVMEFVAGYTIGDWQRRKEKLGEKEALTVAECVADALDYAWTQAGVVHCDIKPDNVIVDADGSVKVADLGLSRTIKAMSRGTGESGEEVLGTPSFISPEQAMAESALDCRSDIYSLGAMLYHLLTGRRLFQGHPDEQVIELQCTGQDENPGKLLPSLSTGVCALVERMLAKDPQFRHADWKAVKEDLARVKAGHLPAQLLPGHAISTVKRTQLTRLHAGPDAAHAALKRWQRADRSSPLALAFKIGAVALGCVIALILALNVESCRHPSQQVLPRVFPATPTASPTTTTVPPDAGPGEAARREFEAVGLWISENPDRPMEGLRRMLQVVALAAGTPVREGAMEEERRLREAVEQKAQDTMRGLASTCEPMLAAGRFSEAARVYETYAGPGADESASLRTALAEQLREQAEGVAAAPEPAAQPVIDVRSVLTQAVAQILEGHVPEAALALASAARDGGDDLPAELVSADRVLQGAAAVDVRVMQSFAGAIGKEITVQFNTGPQVLTVEQVSGTQVVAMCRVPVNDAFASRRVAFGVQDLAMRERLLRMGADSQPEVALVKGMLAFRAQAYPHARDYFSTVPGVLGELLLERSEAEANRPEAPPPQPAETPAAVPEPQPPPRPASSLPRDLLPAKDDIDKVREFMYRRNPKLNPFQLDIRQDKSGKAVSATVINGTVKDLSPLAALTTLTSVAYRPGQQADGALKDLSGLSSLTLDSVEVANSHVFDIEPLRGMPLRRASFVDSPVRDLTPLRGMPLEELDLRRTSVMDLAPLAGMPLKVLKLDGTALRRLQVLKTLPLTHVSAQDTPIQDLSWLQGGPKLTRLDLAGTSIRTIDALAALPLTSLDLSRTPVSDISRLAGMKLTRLLLNRTGVRDFSAISGMPLEEFGVEGTAFSDVGLLSGMPLRRLNLSETGVKDLWAIGGMRLTALSLRNLTVPDLAPAAKNPLTELDLRGCGSLNTQPLHGMKLVHLWIDNPDRQKVFIQSLPVLRFLNDVDLYHAANSPFRRVPPPAAPGK